MLIRVIVNKTKRPFESKPAYAGNKDVAKLLPVDVSL